jgi:site-specific recombinase XerD
MRTITDKNHRTIAFLEIETHIETQVDAFLVDRRAQSKSEGTLGFYRQKLALFGEYCDAQGITATTQLTPTLIRNFILWLQQRGHNDGGVHAFYRTVRTFLYWWEEEYEPEGWKNPIRKVKPPRVDKRLLDPASNRAVSALLGVCSGGYLGARDKAAILFLCDTGCRASEFTGLNVTDYDVSSGAVVIRNGKGGKGRTVFVGRKTRRALRKYLRQRPADADRALWVTVGGDRLTYSGLRQIIRRRADKAGVTPPALHSFRRLFAVQCLRNGMDLRRLQELMGHADLQMLIRYTKLVTDDLRAAHLQASPVDNADW